MTRGTPEEHRAIVDSLLRFEFARPMEGTFRGEAGPKDDNEEGPRINLCASAIDGGVRLDILGPDGSPTDHVDVADAELRRRFDRMDANVLWEVGVLPNAMLLANMILKKEKLDQARAMFSGAFALTERKTPLRLTIPIEQPSGPVLKLCGHIGWGTPQEEMVAHHIIESGELRDRFDAVCRD